VVNNIINLSGKIYWICNFELNKITRKKLYNMYAFRKYNLLDVNIKSSVKHYIFKIMIIN